MNISDYMKHDAVALSKLIKHGEVTVNELIDAAFSRLEEVNPELNAVVRTRKEQVKHECRQLDIRQQPFAGVPILLKDISQALKGSLLQPAPSCFHLINQSAIRISLLNCAAPAFYFSAKRIRPNTD